MSVASGFIYLIILGMWAAYFVPRWISNHEETSGKRTEKFNSAMRSVSSFDVKKSASEDKSAKQHQIRIRRIIFSSLAIILTGNLITVGLGMVSPIVLAIPFSAILIYIFNVRRQVVAEQLKQRRLSALERIASADVVSDPVETVRLSAREDFAESYQEHWIPLLERTETTGVVLLPKDNSRKTWEPVSVPKPTYVGAPKAIVPKRIIDLTVPGAWLETQKISEEDLVAREELFDQLLAEEAAQDRAVNE